MPFHSQRSPRLRALFLSKRSLTPFLASPLLALGLMAVVSVAYAITPPGSNGVAKDPGFVIKPPGDDGLSLVVNPGTGYYWGSTGTHQNYVSGPQDYFALDFVNAQNGEVRAFDVRPIAPGVVEYAGPANGPYLGGQCDTSPPKSGYGNIVFVRHQAGYSSLYAHLESIAVATGQAVDTSSTLGVAGYTGLCPSDANNRHLHLAVYKDAVNNPVIINHANGHHYPSGGQAVVPEPFAQCTMRRNVSGTVTEGLACADINAGNSSSGTGHRLFRERAAPAAIEDSNGQLHVFVKGMDGQLYFKAQDCNGEDWINQWTLIPAPSNLSWTHEPALVLDADGYINVFMRGGDGNIYHNVEIDSANHTFAGWRAFPTLTAGSVSGSLGAPAAILDDHALATTANPNPAEIRIFSAGPGHYLYASSMAGNNTQGAPLGAWASLGVRILNTPAPLQTGTHGARVYFQQTDYLLYRMNHGPNGWTGQAWNISPLQTVGEIAAISSIPNPQLPPDDRVVARTSTDALVMLSPGIGHPPVLPPNMSITRNPATAFLSGSMEIMTRQTGTSVATDGVPLYVNAGVNWQNGTWTAATDLQFHSDLAVTRTADGNIAFFGWDSAWYGANPLQTGVPASTRIVHVPLTTRGPGTAAVLGTPEPASAGGAQPSCPAVAPTPTPTDATVGPEATATPSSIRELPASVPSRLSTRLQWEYRGGNRAAPVGTKIFRDRTARRDPNPVLELVGTVLARQAPQFEHSGVQPETEYCYRLQSFLSPANVSDYSRPRCVRTLAAPSNLGLAVQGTSVRLTWLDNSLYESNYHVQRRLKGASTWEHVANLQRDSGTYLASYVPGTNYCYRVYASNRDGSSLPSSEACTSRNRVLLAAGPASPESPKVVEVLRSQLPDYQFTQISGEPTASHLAGADILVLILPSTSSQLQAVNSFVSGGGSVLVVGEHGSYADLYAPAARVYANAFGLQMAGAGLVSGCSTNSFVTVTNGILGLPVGSRVFVAATDTISGGTPVLSTSTGATVFNVTAYGRGRVAVSGDSNIWSSCGYNNGAFTRSLFGWLGEETGSSAVTAASTRSVVAAVAPVSSNSAVLQGLVSRMEGSHRLRVREGQGREYQVVLNPQATVCRLAASTTDCTEAGWSAVTPGMRIRVEGSLSSDGATVNAQRVMVP